MLKGVHKFLTESFLFSDFNFLSYSMVFRINEGSERFSKQDPETDKEAQLAKLLVVKV